MVRYLDAPSVARSLIEFDTEKPISVCMSYDHTKATNHWHWLVCWLTSISSSGMQESLISWQLIRDRTIHMTIAVKAVDIDRLFADQCDTILENCGQASLTRRRELS